MREKLMKKKPKSEMDDELRPEYDLHDVLKGLGPQVNNFARDLIVGPCFLQVCKAVPIPSISYSPFQ